MENAIYQSMQAAIRLLENQNIIANNLANISTNGFKETFNLIIKDENVNNLYKIQTQKYYNFSEGILTNTQRKLDVIVKDSGWLVIKDMNGKEAYTKNGHLKINAHGQLTIQNYKVVTNKGDIKIPNNMNVKILSDGTIKKIEEKENKIFEKKIGSLKLVRFSKNNLIQKNNGLFYLKKNILNQNLNVPHDNTVRIQSEVLEASNVNPTKNMVDMISNARQFEMNMKMISMYDQNTERANQLFNVNN
ncbi:flagellar basal-body rod protein FlgF [Buchnera aphidicola (Aphis craccivora)]|uniref:Flagellar basal-body rod protein FlgF n=1 Tax=Buchnera aphidicola (Aphis craccivora) TaxID=466616 RepID=A0A4D6XJN9_9GAMM|nr:flagellar basal-body rod protein FlgF [Buchnera aphidicola]QCI16583.1 flagellar basal-body rod protein FlgF [Buchnera aphidicola (Aphis craccivora)]QLL40717.1 flagellar basal-body rod protein FlgF [Buchnera aphidicola (Aphis craccivore)]WAI17556.1 MAG: flagellar basal-body rod protein FlgF [Buchnera aphidicola (Aphis craccivora)]